MIEQMFMPLDRHYDDGMAAMGDAFKESAEKLTEMQEGRRHVVMNGHLPIFYLYRHAIELYLKSAILVVHRFFRMPSGEQPHQREPLIRIDGKWRPLHRTHSLKTLLSELERMLTENMAKIRNLTPTNWSVPQELTEQINAIDACDEGSTYFRYPKSKGTSVDAEKSGCLPADPARIISEMNERSVNGEKGKLVLGLKDEDDNIVEVFAMEEEPLPDLRDALVGAASLMSGACTGLQMELVDGYGKKMFEWRDEATANDAPEREQREEAEPNE